jgi:hypothetical protein
MAIIQTIDNASQFRDQFHRYGREDQFSYEALGLIFDYLSDCGSDVELHVVGICCEFAESDIEQVAHDYDISIAGLTSRGKVEAIEAYLEDNTSVVGLTSTGSFIYVQF